MIRAHSIRTLFTGAFVVLLIPALAAYGAPRAEAQSECQTFAETGYEVCGDLLGFWNDNGGLLVFGYPIIEAAEEVSPETGDMHTVQYFERERLESHPEKDQPYDVLLGRLGVQMLELNERDWQSFPKMDPSEEHYFSETGFAIAPEFWEYWSSHGLEFGDSGFSFRESLLLFGFPISEPQMETNPDGDTVLTQWFERARFEYHPDNDPEFQVLLGRLGAEFIDAINDPGGGDTTEIALELVADGLTSPLMVTEAPDDSGRLFIVDQVGKIWIVMPDGTLVDAPFLDISERMVELTPPYDDAVEGLATGGLEVHGSQQLPVQVGEAPLRSLGVAGLGDVHVARIHRCLGDERETRVVLGERHRPHAAVAGGDRLRAATGRRDAEEVTVSAGAG